ncbi:MAG: hypothetical protein C4583_02675 [Anaerolineaceae bacterium]|nr:MAG: hypothetical protein C4583_02675 [Anaerolineaceae bacterium]
MKTKAILLSTVILLLASCGLAPLPASTKAAAATEEPTSTPTRVPATARPMASPAPTSARSALFAEVENAVEARPSPADEYTPASVGLTILTGGAARTGDDGRARLDLSPDATILRLAPNTIFTLSELEENEDGPFTILKLFIGRIYIILSGGELQVETPSGLASVRGSMMGVSYDPKTGAMTATCLEGHCSLRSRDHSIDLVAGQAADILDGILAREPRVITDGELLDWFEFTPELDGLLDRLPNLRDRLDNLPKLPRPRPRR